MIQALKTFYCRHFAEDPVDGTAKDIRVLDTIESLKYEEIKLDPKAIAPEVVKALEIKLGGEIHISFKTGTIYKDNKAIGRLNDLCIRFMMLTEKE